MNCCTMRFFKCSDCEAIFAVSMSLFEDLEEDVDCPYCHTIMEGSDEDWLGDIDVDLSKAKR